jgi:hypothetical protein
MAELNQIASKSDPFPVFDGTKLHKNAFPKKGKITTDHAVLVAGVLRANLTDDQCNHIKDRMNKVKRVFKRRVEHHAQSMCVQNAIKAGMKVHGGGTVQTYSDILEVLESNCTMESFQNWYEIYYKDFDIKGTGKRDNEEIIMKDLKVRYNDGTTTEGCVGELLMEVMSKLLETIQKRSKDKQGLHLVKSRPGPETSTKRRVEGDYFIVSSDSQNKMIGWSAFNVSVDGVVECCVMWHLKYGPFSFFPVQEN